MKNVMDNQGIPIAIFGTLWVFMGLVFINLSVHLTNAIFGRFQKKETPVDETPEAQDVICPTETVHEDIPLEHSLAIFTAIELYRKLHFDVPEVRLTFKRGQEEFNGWKMGNKFGQRG